MESLFLVLGIVGGLIAGFAITYFAFVGKLQKKLASAKKKLDRAQSANEEAETLQSQLKAQKSERQAAESKLASLEATHQTQISELEAELDALRQFSVAPDQIPPDHSEELAALQARLAEVEQQHQEALQTLEARHQDELESLRQSLTVAPPLPTLETETQVTESLDTEPTDQGNWGAAAIAGGAAAIGAGMAALSNFGQPSPAEAEWMEEPEAIVESEVPELTEDFAPDTDAESETFELTEDFAPDTDADQSPFDQPDAFDQGPFAGAPVAEAEELSPFASPEALVESDNWVDAPEETFREEEADGTIEGFEQPELLADLEVESPFPFETTVEPDIDTENWVDAPDILDQGDNEFITGSIPEAIDLLPDLAETPETGLLDVDDLLPEVGETAELPDLGEADPEMALELPDMTEEPDFGEFSFGDQNLEELSSDIADGDELLAELTGTGDDDTGLELFALEETTAETEALEADLSLPSNPGDTLEMPDSFLADIPSFIPDSDTDTEDISEVGMGSDDDLDFLLQLQEDEPPSSPGEEFLPEFNDDDPLSASFPTMELLADDNSELSDLLGDGRPVHEGDPFVNILDENPHATDNDLLALLQDEEGIGPHQHEGDDDLFSGLEGMLNTDTPDDQSDLDDLDALLNTVGDSGTDQDDVFSLEDLGLGEEKY